MKYTIKKNKMHQVANRYFGMGSYLNPIAWIRRLVSFLMGEKVSRQVLPAQVLREDEFYTQDVEQNERAFIKKVQASDGRMTAQFHEIENFDGSILETMELTHQSQLKKSLEDQQFTIFTVGNGMCMQDLYPDLLLDCEKLEHNVIAFNFRNVIRSEGRLTSQLDLVYDVIAQIERLRMLGVSTKNISLVGHSLGAAVVTLVSYLYYKEGMPLKVFNGRSFSSFSDLCYYQLEENNESYLTKLLSRIKHYLTNFKLEVTPFYRLIPDIYKEYIVVKPLKEPTVDFPFSVPDGVIPPKASLHYALKEDRAEEKKESDLTSEKKAHWKNRKVISTNGLFKMGHNDSLRLLHCRENKQTADEFCRQFVKGNR